VGTGRGWTYDEDKYAALLAARRAEADLMRAYAAGERCLMTVLTDALDDPHVEPCGRCSVCTGLLPAPGARPDEDEIGAARQHLRGRVHRLEPRKLWPSGLPDGRRRVTGLYEGRAVAFADDPAWPMLVAELAGPDAPPSAELVDALVAVLRGWAAEWGHRPTAVVPMPSASRPRRVRGMAAHVAEVGRLPLLDLLEASGPPPPADAASGVRVAALLERIALAPGAVDVPPGPVLLVDDVLRTGWTVTVAASRLVEAGAEVVLPLVGHRRP
jgi:ATP-dependent DNA helicase RecQ